jgi:hypothetical protein
MNPFRIFIFLFVIMILLFFFMKIGEGEKMIYEHPVEDQNECSDTLSVFHDADSFVDVQDSSLTFDSLSFLELYDEDCLSHYFEQLKMSDSSLVRIVYFGDSQIEGDHITSTLRSLLQKEYGGTGIGFMPAAMYFNTTENISVVTNDFDPYYVGSSIDENNYFGFYGRYYVPSDIDALLQIRKRRSAPNYKQLKLLYSGECLMSWSMNKNKLVSEKRLYGESGVDTLSFLSTPHELKINFSEQNNFILHGLLLDPDHGIVVDHVPFRGALHLTMSRYSDALFCAMGELLHPALVIVHFGVNVVPDVKIQYENYRIALQHDLQLLKKYLPQTSLLVVGASDMARKENGDFAVYPNIGAIVDVQRRAARKEKVAFWDLRSAMGGEGAILRWVEKGWARADYAHFTNEGAEDIGRLMTIDLQNAYQQYLDAYE